MSGSKLVTGVLLIAGLACACASDNGAPQRRGPGGRGRGGPPPAADAAPPNGQDDSGLRVFFSPAGEPFRPLLSGPGPLRQWFDEADANHDGAITAAEMLADHMRFFKLLDSDHDGVLSDPEVTNYEEKVAPEILTANDRPDMNTSPGAAPSGRGGGRGGGGRGGRRGGGGRGGSSFGGGGGGAAPRGVDLEGAARFGLINEAEPLRAADTNFDFQTSQAEWVAASARHFDALDANHDGKITFDELRLLQAPPRARRR